MLVNIFLLAYSSLYLGQLRGFTMRNYFIILAALVVTAMPAHAGCVRADPQASNWNIRFTNNCPYPVIVTWYCPGNCQNGCGTGRIPAGRGDNGYCGVAYKYKWQQTP